MPAVEWGESVIKAFTGTASDLALTSGLWRLWATEDCYVNVHGTAAASAGSTPLTAKLPETIVLTGSETMSVISAGTDGTLFATPAVQDWMS